MMTEQAMRLMRLAALYGIPRAQLEEVLADLTAVLPASGGIAGETVVAAIALWGAKWAAARPGIQPQVLVEWEEERRRREAAGVPVPTTPPANNTALGRMVGVERKGGK